MDQDSEVLPLKADEKRILVTLPLQETPEALNLPPFPDASEVLRKVEADLSHLSISSPARNFRNLETPEFANERTFRILKSFEDLSAWEEVPASLWWDTGEILVYVDDADSDDLDPAEMAEVMDNFSSKLSGLRDLFGFESDIDGNGRIIVLLSREVNLISGTQDPVQGFFYAADLYNPEVFSEASNVSEILYAAIPNPTDGFDAKTVNENYYRRDLPGVLAHEFQHLANYSERVLRNGLAAQESWLNESLSHLAEDVAVDGPDFSGMAPGNRDRIQVYFASPERYPIFSSRTLGSRGAGYLLLSYLRERADAGAYPGLVSGIELIRELKETPLTGVMALSNLVEENGQEGDWIRTYGDFALSLVVSQHFWVGQGPYLLKELATENSQTGLWNSSVGPALNPDWKDQEAGAFMFEECDEGRMESAINGTTSVNDALRWIIRW